MKIQIHKNENTNTNTYKLKYKYKYIHTNENTSENTKSDMLHAYKLNTICRTKSLLSGSFAFYLSRKFQNY